MTETTTPGPAPAVSTTPRWMKIALSLSVALNLAVAGLAVGARLGDGHQRGLPRDMSFGPFSEALGDEDRRAIRRGLVDRIGDFRAAREAARVEFETLLAALRADPFDPGAVSAALTSIATRNADRLELGRSLIEARIAEMTPDERLAFADRLERGLRHGGRKDD